MISRIWYSWTSRRKVVVKRPSQPGYGVEIGGKIEAGRVQMRTVAIRNANAPADFTRYRDAETIFCGDVTDLQAQFAEAGGEIVTERTLPVGATPPRVVPDALNRNDEDIKEPTRSERSLGKT